MSRAKEREDKKSALIKGSLLMPHRAIPFYFTVLSNLAATFTFIVSDILPVTSVGLKFYNPTTKC
jgi:hypothetical protein